MKKIFCSLCVLVLVLTSCSQGERELNCDIETNFTAKVDILGNVENLSCLVSRASSGVFLVDVCDPEDLRGLKISNVDGKYTISYNDLNYETNNPCFPQESMFKLLKSVFDSTEKRENLAEYDSHDNMSFFKGNCDLGEFKIVVNNKTKYIEKIDIEDKGIEIILSDHKS